MFKNIVDMHTHTNNSFDGNYLVEQMCESAVAKGVKSIAFTDHVEIDFFTEKGFDRDARSSFEDVSRAKNEYKESLEVIRGVELGQPTYDVQTAEKLTNTYDYDFVIGSIHNLRNFEDFALLDFSDYDVYELLDAYFNELKQLAAWAGFDTLAHLTYPLRYIVGEQKIDVDLSRYSGDIDEVLSLLAEKDRALEINTSGLRQKIGLTMPGEAVVKRFKQLGGKLVTVGSDSHFTDHVAAGIQQGMEIALRCGFKSVQVFRGRTPFDVSIE